MKSILAVGGFKGNEVHYTDTDSLSEVKKVGDFDGR